MYISYYCGAALTSWTRCRRTHTHTHILGSQHQSQGCGSTRWGGGKKGTHVWSRETHTLLIGLRQREGHTMHHGWGRSNTAQSTNRLHTRGGTSVACCATCLPGIPGISGGISNCLSSSVPHPCRPDVQIKSFIHL